MRLAALNGHDEQPSQMVAESAVVHGGEGDQLPVRRWRRMRRVAGNIRELPDRAISDRDRVEVDVVGPPVPIGAARAGNQHGRPIRRPYQPGRHVVRKAVVPHAAGDLPGRSTPVDIDDEDVEHALRQLTHRIMPVEQPVRMARPLRPFRAFGCHGEAEPIRQRRIDPCLEGQAASVRRECKLAHRRARPVQHDGRRVARKEGELETGGNTADQCDPPAVRREPRDQRALAVRHIRPGRAVGGLRQIRHPRVCRDVSPRDDCHDA